MTAAFQRMAARIRLSIFPVGGMLGLCFERNGVDVGGVCGEGDAPSRTAGDRYHFIEQIVGAACALEGDYR